MTAQAWEKVKAHQLATYYRTPEQKHYPTPVDSQPANPQSESLPDFDY